MVALLEAPPRLRIDHNRGERRTGCRWPEHGRVDARRLDHALGARRWPYVSLVLRDRSAGGIGAVSPTPLEVGEFLQIGFPHPAPASMTLVTGQVVWCEAAAFGFDVAIAFDIAPAAC